MGGVTEKPSPALEAERAVLGSLLIDGSIACELIAAVDEQDFTSSVNRLVFQAARAVLREGGSPDPVIIRGRLGSALGPDPDGFLIALMEVTPTSANWREYAQLMREQAALARVKSLAAELREADSLDGCRPLIAGLQNALTARRGVRVTRMADLLEHFAARHAEGKDPNYARFGISVLDNNTFVRGGDVVVLGGYPSDGKTALALMMAYHMAKGKKVGFFSLETDEAKLGDRIVTQGMQIDFDTIKRSRLTDRDWGTFAAGSDDAAARQLEIIEASGMTASDIIAHALAHGYEAIFLDYIQLVTPEGSPRDLYAQRMAEVSRTLHTFAQQRGVLVVELAQLSRPERGAWRAPDMHDLKETGQFEQDADLIVMVYRPDPKSIYSQEKCRVIQIAKCKEGRRGSGVFAFDGRHQTFRPYNRDEEKGRKEKTDGEAPGQVKLEEIANDKEAPF